MAQLGEIFDPLSVEPWTGEASFDRVELTDSEVVAQFGDAMRDAGMTPPVNVVVDGTLHRFDPDGGRGDAGWYVVHRDGIPAGAFGDWRRGGEAHNWRADVGCALTPAEKFEQRRRTDDAQRQRDAERDRRHADAEAKTAAICASARPAGGDHPYTTRKGVAFEPKTAKELTAEEILFRHGERPTCKDKATGKWRPLVGRILILPVEEEAGGLASLQFIDSDGRKTNLAGGKSGGNFWCAQSMPDGDGAGLTIMIGEGAATVLSARAATGFLAVAAFSCGNLVKVAEAMRRKFPASRLLILADKGNGEDKAREAGQAVGAPVAVPTFDDGSPDATDWNDLTKLAGTDEVRRQILGVLASAPEPTPPTVTEPEPWPILAEAAMPGIIGEFVELATQNSEADPAAVLATFMAAMGCAFGRDTKHEVGDSDHHARFFIALVGDSSRARKGTSAEPVKKLMKHINEKLVESSGPGLRIVAGPLSTGEGLAYELRDPVYKEDDETGEIKLVDAGVTDKRLFVIEGEFGAVLKAGERQGNTLSTALRQAWDGASIAPMTKGNRISATDPHLGIVGHITQEELSMLLTASDLFNGFANRFLWLSVRRPKLVPEPIPMDEERLGDIARRLALMIQHARQKARCLQLDSAASKRWREVYPKLTTDYPGPFGVVTARAEAQTKRLAMNYAIIAGCDFIGVQHLESALAFLDYSRASAKRIFGGLDSNPLVNKIAGILKTGPKTTADIHKALSGHCSKEQLSAALDTLQKRGTAKIEVQPTGGRPANVWTLIQ